MTTLFYIICSVICLQWTEADNIHSQLSKHVYSKEYNTWISSFQKAEESFKECSGLNCYSEVIEQDLKPFSHGIKKHHIDAILDRGTLYQIINHNVYQVGKCMFPARCSGIEHFLNKIKNNISNIEFVINTRDYPQVLKHSTKPLPVFSFSKTYDYFDIMYPTWAFWEGGPAIKLYPTGIGRWDKHRLLISKEADKFPWYKKLSKGFFRGSRTSSERDPLVLLSRENPDLVDAKYTKNQAWKSDADTLYAPPADEVSFENHCKYKFLFNFRGVAASFRLKHLFLCKSLVFHVGDEWLEFFYPAIKPWIHYVPVDKNASKEDIEKLLIFFLEHNEIAEKIALRGYEFVADNLRMKHVTQYWEMLLKNYASLLKYKPQKRN